MTTTHTETPRAGARETALPTVRRRRKRRDWGRMLARALCIVLAVVGVLPFATTVAVRSQWVRSWAARETERALRDQGIVARYAVALRVWPLAVELTDVHVDSLGGGAPLLECARARIRPKLFALLAGKLAIDQVEIDQPRVHIVVKDGKLVNLRLPATPASQGPVRAPFNAFALTDASLDLQIDDIRADASAVDLDVTVEQDPTAGSTFELALRVGRAGVHRPRVRPDGSVASDDDALCSIDGRVRIEPEAVLVRRLEGIGSADSLFVYGVGRIVVWVPAASGLDPASALKDAGVRHVAIANPQHAPYGRAAEAALRSLGLYSGVENKLVLGEDIAQTFEFVESGAADAGIVALSLALAPAARGKGRYWEIPLDAYPRIEQGGLLLKESADTRAVRAFLVSVAGRVILKRYGFYPPGTG